VAEKLSRTAREIERAKRLAHWAVYGGAPSNLPQPYTLMLRRINTVYKARGNSFPAALAEAQRLNSVFIKDVRAAHRLANRANRLRSLHGLSLLASAKKPAKRV
jgi:hypothetical protein